MNRRSFFQTVVGMAGVATLLALKVKAEGRGGGSAAAVSPTLVDPKDPGAKAVSYVADGKDVKDKALQADRAGVKFKDQKCMGCAFYEKDKEASVGGKKAAPCKMPFANGKYVAAAGWCTSWAKK